MTVEDTQTLIDPDRSGDGRPDITDKLLVRPHDGIVPFVPVRGDTPRVERATTTHPTHTLVRR
ncbi:hypothetical protein PSA01_30720 [Pseudonocardia saturnea]|uniref:Uncharacterized protein n=1 Tax=Pseudonocardia saturnea TaxID=33909 RepID=A0ABQ0RZE2_9PSEU|nr:hypothetical protein Pdca_12870 [Pseudonocardia autotrophica]GEC26043.1 hypothetical protein PSA01_30720 [Pseudonocardia saturnea]